MNHTVCTNALRRPINILETRLLTRAYCIVCWYRVAPGITGFCSTNKSRSPTRLQRTPTLSCNATPARRTMCNHRGCMRHHALCARNCRSWADVTVYSTPPIRTLAPAAGLHRLLHFRCFSCITVTTALSSSTHPRATPRLRGKWRQSCPQPSQKSATPGISCKREANGTSEPRRFPLDCPPATTFFWRSPLAPVGQRVETVDCVVANFNDRNTAGRVTLVVERCFWCSGPQQPLAPLPLKLTET